MGRRREDPGDTSAEPALGWVAPDPGLTPDGHADVTTEPALVEAAAPGDEFAPAGDEPALAWTGRTDLPTFAATYRARRALTTPGQVRIAVLLATTVGGLFAIGTAFFAAGGTGSWAAVLGAVLFAPLVEELGKASGALYLVERHPWRVPNALILPLITLTAGLVFAVVENVLYLEVYIEDPSPAIVTWRWIAGPLLHGGCALLSGIGVGRMWRAIDAGEGLPDIRHAARWLLAAMLVHGLYNLSAIVLEVGGWLPI